MSPAEGRDMNFKKLVAATLFSLAILGGTAGVASARQGADDPAGHGGDDGSNHR